MNFQRPCQNRWLSATGSAETLKNPRRRPRHALMTQRLFPALLLAASWLGAAPLPDFNGVREEHLMIPMRDGKRLSAYVYFPDGRGKMAGDLRAALRGHQQRGLAQGGGEVCRGRLRHRARQLPRHARERGRVARLPRAAMGRTARRLRRVRVARRAAVVHGKDRHLRRFAGRLRAELSRRHAAAASRRAIHDRHRPEPVSRGLPHRRRDAARSASSPAAKSRAIPRTTTRCCANGTRIRTTTTTGATRTASLHFDKMNVPCFTIGSWFDFMVQGSVASFIGRQQHGGPNSRGQQQLLLGPWLHGGYPKSNKIGELVFPENALFDVYAHMTKWFNHYLKGEDNGVEKEAARALLRDGRGRRSRRAGQCVARGAGLAAEDASARRFFLHEPDGALARRQRPSAAKGEHQLRERPAPADEHPRHRLPRREGCAAFEEQSEVRTWTTDAADASRSSGPAKSPPRSSSVPPRRTPTSSCASATCIPTAAACCSWITRCARAIATASTSKCCSRPASPRSSRGTSAGRASSSTRATASASPSPAPARRFYEPNNQTGGPQTVDWMKTDAARHQHHLARRRASLAHHRAGDVALEFLHQHPRVAAVLVILLAPRGGQGLGGRLARSPSSPRRTGTPGC